MPVFERKLLTGRSPQEMTYRENQRRASRLRMDAMSAKSRLVGAALTVLLHLLVWWLSLRVAEDSDIPRQPPAL